MALVRPVIPPCHNCRLDNITHTLTGLFLSRAGLNRITPSATPILLIAANLPDLDIVSALGGSLTYLHWHRHFTHSLLFAPVFALALAALFRLFRPGLAFLPAAAVALLGILSHLLLDLTNIYGIRILLPLRDTWYGWDLTPIIDFWIWAAFALAIASPFLARLVGSEIGERRGSSNGRGFAIAALLFLTLYNGGRAVLHNRVLQTLNSREYSGAAPLRVAAFPSSLNPLRWHAVAETDSAYRLTEYSLPLPFNPALAESLEKAAPSPALEAASRTEPFRVFGNFAQFPIYRVIPRAESGGGFQIELSDLRFNFVSTALVNRQNQVEKSSFSFGTSSPR